MALTPVLLELKNSPAEAAEYIHPGTQLAKQLSEKSFDELISYVCGQGNSRGYAEYNLGLICATTKAQTREEWMAVYAYASSRDCENREIAEHAFNKVMEFERNM